MNILKIYGLLQDVEDTLIKLGIIEYQKSVQDGYPPILRISLEECDQFKNSGLIPMRCVLINLSNNKYFYSNNDINHSDFENYYKFLED